MNEKICVMFTEEQIAEDVIDTGRTMRFLADEFTRRGAKRVLTCVLLDTVES